MKTVTKLTDKDSGVWQVKTEASSYLIDLDKRRFLRNPGDGAGPDPSIPGRIVRVGAMLGTDSTWTPLQEVQMCQVGSSMMLIGVGFTWVISTIVRSIEQVVNND